MRQSAEVLASVRHDADEWLHDAERRVWRRMTNTRRSQSFLAGRVLAKRVLCSFLDPYVSPRQLLIASPAVVRDSTGVTVFCDSERLPWQLSLAHSARHVGAVVFHVESTAFGLDIVDLADVHGTRLHVWMSDEERRQFPAADSAVCWCLKEAAFKALADGTPFEPRSFRVVPDCRADRGYYHWTFRGKKNGTARVWSRSDCVVALAESPRRNADGDHAARPNPYGTPSRRGSPNLLGDDLR